MNFNLSPRKATNKTNTENSFMQHYPVIKKFCMIISSFVSKFTCICNASGCLLCLLFSAVTIYLVKVLHSSLKSCIVQYRGAVMFVDVKRAIIEGQSIHEQSHGFYSRLSSLEWPSLQWPYLQWPCLQWPYFQCPYLQWPCLQCPYLQWPCLQLRMRFRPRFDLILLAQN